MRRIVLDINIVLSGLLWRGPPYAVMTHIGQNPAYTCSAARLCLMSSVEFDLARNPVYY